MKRMFFILALFALLVAGVGTALAESYLWSGHAAPFDFLFGNHIDAHQQTAAIDGDKLEGFFYIRFTGETLAGVPVAEHADCEMMPENCVAGWLLFGKAARATLLSHEEGQHPTWCVDPADIPARRGYSHFHWLGQPEHAGQLVVGQTYDGYILKLTARETFFFRHHAGFLVTPGLDRVTHANIVTDCD